MAYIFPTCVIKNTIITELAADANSVVFPKSSYLLLAQKEDVMDDNNLCLIKKMGLEKWAKSRA